MTVIQKSVPLDPENPELKAWRRFLAVIVFMPVLVHATDQRASSFTVADAIAMEVLEQPASDTNSQDVDQWSPNGKLFFAVTIAGDSGANTRTARLYVFKSTGIGPEARLDQGKVIAKFSNRTNFNPISQARWIDSSNLAFLGTEGVKPPQVFMVSVEGRVDQLTSHPTAVGSFAISPDRTRLLFQAEKPEPDVDEIARGYWGGNSSQVEIFGWGMRFLPMKWREYFTANLKAGTVRRLEVPDYFAWPAEQTPISISPDGNQAIILSQVPDAEKIITWLRSYPFGNAALDPEPINVDHQSPTIALLRWQYFLMDLKKGAGVPLIDAPALFAEHPRVAWDIPRNRVIVTDTLLPLTDSAKPSSQAVLAIVDIDSMTVHRVIDMPKDWSAETIVATAEKEIEVAWVKASERSVRRYVQESTTQWREIPLSKYSRELRVAVSQELNTPPQLATFNTRSGERRTITALNPWLKQLSIGRAQVVNWVDGNKKEREGLLLEPEGYKAGSRYPLVVQTHGAKKDLFWVNGSTIGSTSGASARALASRGMFVLQTSDDFSEVGTPNEIAVNAEIIESGVLNLVHKGLVDVNRVGVHGNSRSGYYVQRVLFSERIPFAAATVAEADAVSRDQYIKSFGTGSSRVGGMTGFESVAGLPPLWGAENARLWTHGDLTNRLSETDTPLLIQNYATFIGESWDIYALLRRNGRAAEFIYFPDGWHTPAKAGERLVAQGSVVDWYDFWLDGGEDASAAKAKQYSRWRAMRAAQCRLPEIKGRRWYCTMDPRERLSTRGGAPPEAAGSLKQH